MIKVLHVFNHYLPKTENWAYQLISNTPNCEQHIAAKVYQDHMPGKDDFQFMENPTSDLEAADQDTDWKKNILKKVIIRASKKLNKSFGEQLINYVSEHKIDLVHAHFANMGWECQEVLSDISIPIVVSFYGWDYEMLPHVKPEWQEKYTEMFNRVNLILVEGKHGIKTLSEKGCSINKIKVQKLGIGKKLIKEVKRKKAGDNLKLIQIASFTEKKGQIFSVKSFAKALLTCPNMHLTLIGDSREDAYHEIVSSFVKDNELEEHITIKDFIAYDELEAELSKHHVFLHPSCYAHNMNCEGGAPTIIFNAAGSGMPTIATRHCDIPSLVLNNVTGLLSEEKDIESIANHISRFYKMDQSDYDSFAKAAHNHIANNYAIEENGRDLLGYYQELINKPS